MNISLTTQKRRLKNNNIILNYVSIVVRLLRGFNNIAFPHIQPAVQCVPGVLSRG
jgi:hypothetical protein